MEERQRGHAMAIADAADDYAEDQPAENDPLAPWIRQVESCKQSASPSCELKALLEDATTRFQSHHQYRNDERYIQLWVTYADMCRDPSKVFRLLLQRQIGTQLALFWVAWAYAAEASDDYDGAARIYHEAQTRGARPAAVLQECHRAFQERMLQRLQCVAGKFAELWDPGTLGVQRRRLAGGADNHSTAQQGPGLEEEARKSVSRGGGGGGRIHSALCSQDPNTSSVGHSTRGKQTASTGVPPRHGDAVVVVDDPFEDKHRRRFTTGTDDYKRWAQSSSLIHDLRNEKLGKKWPRKMRSGQGAQRSCSLGKGTVDVLCILGEGAYAQVYACCLRGDHCAEEVAVKVERPRCHTTRWLYCTPEQVVNLPWECFITLQLRDRLRLMAAAEGQASSPNPQSTSPLQVGQRDASPSGAGGSSGPLLGRSERLQVLASSSPLPLAQQTGGMDIQVVRPLGLYVFGDGCCMSMAKGDSGTLHTLVAAYAVNTSAGCMPELVAMHYTAEMLRYVRALHSASILHMDIKPDNWLLVTHKDPPSSASGPGPMEAPLRCKDASQVPAPLAVEGLSLIDFGRSIDLLAYPCAGERVMFRGRCVASGFHCPAMTEDLPWKHEPDLYGLGACIHFMLHGAYLVPRLTEADKDGGGDDDDDGGQGAFHAPQGVWMPSKPCKRYWAGVLWDNVFRKLLNWQACAGGAYGDKEDTGATAGSEGTRVCTHTSTLLAELEGQVLRHLESSPEHVQQLRHLLRQQANMLRKR